jgi:hypothetical protein
MILWLKIFCEIRWTVMPQSDPPAIARHERAGAAQAPRVLHHVMGRGIERRKIFIDKTDRQDFITRLAALVKDSSMWSLEECFLK